jgi:hypothetical protein
MNCREALTQLQDAGRCGGGVAKPGLLKDGDGTGPGPGGPQWIRGRRRQYRSRQYQWFLGKWRQAAARVPGSSVVGFQAGADAGRATGLTAEVAL